MAILCTVVGAGRLRWVFKGLKFYGIALRCVFSNVERVAYFEGDRVVMKMGVLVE
jgi:hypothetical protein